MGGQSQRDLPPAQSGSRRYALPALPRIASALDYPGPCISLRSPTGAASALVRRMPGWSPLVNSRPAARFRSRRPGPPPSFVDESDGRPRSDVDLASFCQMPSS